MLAWVLKTPLLFEGSSNILFFKRIFHYKAPEICFNLIIFLKFFFYFIKHAEHLIKKKILFSCSNARDVPVKSFIAYIITPIVF